MSRYTLTIKYTDGREEEFEHEYLYATYDHLDRIREVNKCWHDVASVVIHDSKYGDDVYELGEVARMKSIKVTDGMFEAVHRFFGHNHIAFYPMNENNEDYVEVIETIIEEGMRIMVLEHGFKFPSTDEEVA